MEQRRFPSGVQEPAAPGDRTVVSQSSGEPWSPCESVSLRRSNDYRAALKKVNEAIALAPEHAGAFLERSKVYLYELGTKWGAMTPEERLQHAELAFADSSRCVGTSPDWNSPYLFDSQNRIYLALLRPDPRIFHSVIANVGEMLSDGWPSPKLSDAERGFALSCRGEVLPLPRGLQKGRDRLLGVDSIVSRGAALVPQSCSVLGP